MPQTTAPLTTSEAAARLRVHRDTLIRWADAGKVPFWRTPGGQRRFDPTVIEGLMAPETPAEAS